MIMCAISACTLNHMILHRALCTYDWQVVRAISGKGQVFQNCLFYSLADGHGKVVCLGAERTKF